MLNMITPTLGSRLTVAGANVFRISSLEKESAAHQNSRNGWFAR
jgi:hypothetical protein